MTVFEHIDQPKVIIAFFSSFVCFDEGDIQEMVEIEPKACLLIRKFLSHLFSLYKSKIIYQSLIKSVIQNHLYSSIPQIRCN